MKTYNGWDEHIIVANAMIKYGGSFVEELGHALLKADRANRRKIKSTWSEYWANYLAMGIQSMEKAA